MSDVHLLKELIKLCEFHQLNTNETIEIINKIIENDTLPGLADRIKVPLSPGHYYKLKEQMYNELDDKFKNSIYRKNKQILLLLDFDPVIVDSFNDAIVDSITEETLHRLQQENIVKGIKRNKIEYANGGRKH